jgi:hypothetical protein
MLAMTAISFYFNVSIAPPVSVQSERKINLAANGLLYHLCNLIWGAAFSREYPLIVGSATAPTKSWRVQ